jgi:hypothetical protein
MLELEINEDALTEQLLETMNVIDVNSLQMQRSPPNLQT